MVRANLRFVVSVAKQYQGQGMPLIDMISEGNVGLIKAAEKFDETRGFKFISYAVWWIRQSIMAAISEHSRTVRLPLSQTSNIYKIRRAASSLEQKFEREPTTLEGDKVNVQWIIKSEFGTVATIYDWKLSETPMGVYDWHIGGFNQRAVELVTNCMPVPVA